jgi:heme/copper-type cytochrome/quinol oxidase subunit 2
MTNQFTAVDTNFSSRFNPSLVRLTLIFSITFFIGLVFIFAVMTTQYPPDNPDGTRGSKWAAHFEALANMSAISFLIIAFISVVAAIALARAEKYGRHDRELIIGITFNDEQKKLALHTKTPGNQEYRRTHKYSELTHERNQLLDSMTAGYYHTLSLVKGGRHFAGHLYLDHFTWDAHAQNQITARIKSVIKLSPDQAKTP